MSTLTTAILAPIFINALLALSQAIPLRAGSFSFATAGTAAIGGYLSAYLVTAKHWPALLAVVVAVAAAAVVSAALAVSLRRLRGVFAAIASIAFVEVVQTGVTNWNSVTGGAQGLSGIPLLLGITGLGLILAGTVVFLVLVERTTLGRAFDAVRQDEAAAASLGISIGATHTKALLLSGALGGLAGVGIAYNSSAIFPDTYGFALVLEIVTFVYVGGFRSWRGPIVGAAIVTILPEVFRSLKQDTNIVYGAILILVIVLLPNGIVDSIEVYVRRRIREFGKREVEPIVSEGPQPLPADEQPRRAVQLPKGG